MPAPLEQRHGDFLISDAPARLDAAAIHAYLRRSYWSENIPLEVVQRALLGSLCVGAYRVQGRREVSTPEADAATPGAVNGPQIGLVRVISDFATFAYLCVVYVLEEAGRAGPLGRPRISRRRAQRVGVARASSLANEENRLTSPSL